MNIDLEAQTFSPEQAEEILALLYRTYHGPDRTVDETARKDLLPLLTDYGAAGLAWVTDIIVHSDEMNARVTRDITALWLSKEGCWREPASAEIEQYGKWPRFLGERGIAILQKKISDAETVRQKAIKQKGAGHPPEALAELERALPDVIAGRWDFWHEHGDALYRQGRYAEAIASYRRAIEWNVDNDAWGWSCSNLRYCYENLSKQDPQRRQEGFSYFQGILQRFPRRWGAHHACGWFAWTAGKPHEAIPHYHKAIALNPDDGWEASCGQLRQCYEETAQNDQGCDYFAKLTIECPKRWPAWHSLALLRWHSDKPDRVTARNAAVDAYRQAIAHCTNKGWFHSWQDMGWCLNELGKYADALEAHRKAGQIDMTRWEPRYAMGRDAEGLKHYFLAWLAYRKALEVEPTHQQSQQAVAELEEKWSPWTELRKLMDLRLGVDDLRLLCFDMGIDWDGLEAGAKSVRITELLKILLRRQRIMDIIIWIQRERPDMIPSLL